MLKLAQHFSFFLGAGVFLFSWIASPKLTGVGFFKLVTSTSMGFIFLSLALGGWGISFYPLGAFFVTLVIFWSLSKKDERDLFHKFMWGASALLASYAGYEFCRSLDSGWSGHLFYYGTSLLLIGVVTYTMILGHWYLVTPKLTEAPLKVGHKVMWALFAVKIALTIWCFMDRPELYFENGSMRLGSSFNWIMLSMRVLWGYVVVGVMSYFSWRLVCMRSIQSATGILYVMVFFSLIGELISLYMLVDKGVYL